MPRLKTLNFDVATDTFFQLSHSPVNAFALGWLENRQFHSNVAIDLRHRLCKFRKVGLLKLIEGRRTKGRSKEMSMAIDF